MQVHILLVDDNVDQTALIQEVVKDAESPIALNTVHSATDALDLLRHMPPQSTPDVLLLDIRMPSMSGFEMLAHLREDHALRVLPCIIFSSSDRSDDIRKAYELGANSYIVKPVSIGGYTLLFKRLYEYWIETVRTSAFH